MEVKNLRIWRDKILKRDNYTCQECGGSQRLEAHHVKSKVNYPDFALETENGVTLCKLCHRIIPRERSSASNKGALTVGLLKVMEMGGNLVIKLPSEFVETHHIESEKELRKEWFEGKHNIGVTAGASTPENVINNVIDRIKNGF